MKVKTCRGKKEKFHKHEFEFTWITQEGLRLKSCTLIKKIFTE